MAEQVQPNKPLSGKELKEIIVGDITNILEQDGMLASHIAYNRVAYSVTVKVMTNNPIIPNWPNRTKSKKSTPQQIEVNEALTAVEAFPLVRTEEDEAADFGFLRNREIVSPNQSRIENGLGVPITFRGPDGDMKEEKVHYEVDTLPDDNPFADVVTERALTDAEIVATEE
jgi:hypothetical protein